LFLVKHKKFFKIKKTITPPLPFKLIDKRNIICYTWKYKGGSIMNVANNQLCFNVKDNQVSVKSKGAMTLEDMVQVTMTGLLGAMHTCLKAARDANEEKQLKEYIYDRFNQAASRTLEIFAPEIEMRPNLTTDAILKAENELLMEEIKKAEADESYKVKY
jgi:hypothetical protein